MKIAIIFDGLGYGGIERVGIDYVRMFVEMGYEVDVYNLHPRFDALVQDLPSEVTYRPRTMDRKLCPELYSYGIQKWWWGKYAYAIISPIITIAQSMIKIFWKRFHYDVAIAMAGHINDISVVAKDFIKASKKVCWCHGNLLSYLAICDAYTILYKKIDYFVTLSSAGEKDIYPGRYFFHEKKICKIYNPTRIMEKIPDHSIIDQLRNQFGKFVLMIARAEYRKGYDIAIEVAGRIKECRYNINFVFVGDGDKLEEYKKLARERGIEEVCHFEGSKNNVRDYIEASYVNLLTSRWEGLPTVIVEAMTLGKPCVMSNTDDGEVSGNGRYCRLVNVEDVDATVRAIIELYEDENEYKKYQQLSQKRAEDFKPEVVRMQLKNFLEL